MADAQTKPAAVPGREERIKLRSAQDKPECQRCKTIGAQCHYSRSMRMGKPRKSAKAKAMMNAKLPGKPAPGDMSHVNSAIENPLPSSINNDNVVLPTTELPWSTDWSFDNLLAAHDHMAANTASATPAADPFRAFFDQHNGNGNTNNANVVVSTADLMNVDALSAGYSNPRSQSDDAFLSFPQSPVGMQKPLKDEPENVYLSPSSYYAPSFESTLLSTGSSPFEDLGPSLLSQQNSHDCTHLALETMTSLCLPSTVQRTAEGQPRPTIDQVLKINSDAMKNVSTILSCSCAKDSSFPMLLSTIFSKALAWYRAAVKTQDVAFDGNSNGNSVKEEVVHRPISVGGYELDDESSDLMKIQLVLNRLRMMSKPIKQYIELYSGSECCHDQPISPSSTAGSPIETKTSNAAFAVGCAQMYSAMGSFIQANLQSTIDELQSKLAMAGGHLQ
ncbi:aflatoxin biosynthesis regulatory protein, putative [Talaromyces stipitatus ATCC 10500]|uniref:Aflatoxin biosynthesis regulatory protein, putative n=1 Tax=Talaromyces stipitatus (strain ATCC 10500 / CBS 375.48 / QM 6759 / NRRL 1006) TaxID=441959 RepID=B8MIG3_TALSN|nr:aflatoxin biosynthesis regulatory protein, putative [Talaromyces stipitatus ATCC 10500]EED14647.1 aflatoxin biosynthesis regulatory protein, putative [Talaromyces stipitatus ATCC 10500]